ncbi:MAG: DEAD/DEAH box helicase family protein [Nitrospirota bacterium]
MTVRTLPAWSLPLRSWQRDVDLRFAASSSADFLIVATPGSGKTTAALRCAHRVMTSASIERIVVVCPTNHLRGQWAEAAGRTGIQLDPFVMGDGHESRDYHGMVVTYQQVCGNPGGMRHACHRQRTLVILDEIHHAGDGKEWGQALRAAFGDAERRLSLSGTPFRSDAATIPFVRYDNGVSIADYAYGYEAALRDHVCRPVYFSTYGGYVSWRTGDGGIASASFTDDLPDKQRRERLKAAILNEGWAEAVLRPAHAKLMDLRRQHRDAGGLVIASSQDHARVIAGILRGSIGVHADIAVSDDPAASRIIRRFAQSDSPWLVAVNMVSEGVDIPRLRVGAFCTNILTEMYFRQVTGRFVRRQPHLHGPQRAFLYLPADPVLSHYAKRIGEERDHVLQAQDPPDPKQPHGLLSGAEQTSLFSPLEAHAQAQEIIAPIEQREAAFMVQPPVQSAASSHPAPLFAQKNALRTKHKRLVGMLSSRTGRSHREINVDLIRSTGSRIETATVAELERRIAILEQQLDTLSKPIGRSWASRRAAHGERSESS